MANISTYLSNALLQHAVGKTSSAYTMPTTYITLFTTNPTMPAGTGAVETTYTGWTGRIAISGSWAASASESITTNANISFPAATSSATIVGWGIYDASTSGNLLWAGTCSLAVSSGITPSFASGALTVALT